MVSPENKNTKEIDEVLKLGELLMMKRVLLKP